MEKGMGEVVNTKMEIKYMKDNGMMIVERVQEEKYIAAAVGMKDNSKMAYKMVRVLYIIWTAANKKGGGRIIKSMATVWKIKLMVVDMRGNMKTT